MVSTHTHQKMNRCIQCSSPTQVGCSICLKAICSNCFHTTHDIACIGVKLKPFTEKEKASIVFLFSNRGTEGKDTLDFVYGYHEIVRRFEILGLDVVKFKADVQAEVQRLRRDMNIYTDRVFRYTALFANKMQIDDTDLMNLPSGFLNPTVPVNMYDRYVRFFTRWVTLISKAETKEQQVLLRAAAMQEAVNDDDFVLFIDTPYRFFFIWIDVEWKPPAEFKDDVEFKEVMRHFGSIDFGAWLIHQKPGDEILFAKTNYFLDGQGPSMYIIYQLALRQIAAANSNLVDNVAFLSFDSEYVVVPKGTYVYRAMSSKFFANVEERSVAVWFAFEKMNTSHYILPTDTSGKHTLEALCNELGGINVYSASIDIRLLNLSNFEMVTQLRQSMKNNATVLDAFDRTVIINSDASTIKRDSYTELDRIWVDWMCANTAYKGFAAPQIGSLPMEIMVCDPWSQFQYVGRYDADDLGVHFCSDDYAIYKKTFYNAA